MERHCHRAGTGYKKMRINIQVFMPKREHWLTDYILDYRGAQMSWWATRFDGGTKSLRLINKEKELPGRHETK